MTTWILLRGLTRESAHWGGFPQTLSERLPGAEVVALDLPGNGSLHAEPSPVRIEAMTQRCLSRLRALGITPPWHLLAMSLGAMVAVDWAARHPHTLAGCVLVNTSLRPFSPWYRRLRPANYGALLALALLPRSSRMREETILRLTSRHLATSAAVIDDWTQVREARPVSPANALRQLAAAARYRAPNRAPGVPLLALVGRGDTLVNPRCSRDLAQRWAADLVEHPSAGHDLPLDDGPWVADQVGRWLQRLEPQRDSQPPRNRLR